MEENPKISAEVLKLPLHERAEMALREAVRKVIESNARDRLPVYVWRDGKVVAVPAEELLKQQ